MKSKLTIILVNYNQKEDIIECLESLHRSKYRPRQIIISDNGSNDGSRQEIRTRFPEVIIVENKANIGFAEANNRAVKSLIQDDGYILLLNSDTVVTSNALGKLMCWAKNTPFDIMGPKVCYYDQPKTVWFAGGFFDADHCSFYHRHQNMKDEGTVESIPCDFITGCALLMKTTLYQQLGGFDGGFFMYCEDLDLCTRAKMLDKTVGCISEPVILHKIIDRGIYDAKPLGRYYYVRNMLYTIKRLKYEKGVSFTKSLLYCIIRSLRAAAVRPLVGFTSFCGVLDFLLKRKGRCPLLLEKMLVIFRRKGEP